MARRYIKIEVGCCGECPYYSWKKHKCGKGATAEVDYRIPFYDEHGHDEEYSFDNVEDWLRDQCQNVCKKWQDCHCNIFRCEAIRSIPAITKVERRNEEDEQ